MTQRLRLIVAEQAVEQLESAGIIIQSVEISEDGILIQLNDEDSDIDPAGLGGGTIKSPE